MESSLMAFNRVWRKKRRRQRPNTEATDVTGPADAKKAILVIYDIFGYFEQTLQGADILANSGEEKYKVLIPDWFKGKPCPIEM
jgi:dienelactone hydrolase